MLRATLFVNKHKLTNKLDIMVHVNYKTIPFVVKLIPKLKKS